MNAHQFCRKAKVPSTLAEHLVILNPDEDFSPYLYEPQDWHSLTRAQRVLHGVKLLGNAYGYWCNKGATYGVDRDELLYDVFPALINAARDPLAGVKNVGGYLFTVIRNDMGHQLEAHRNRLFSSLEIDKLLSGGGPHQRGGKRLTAITTWDNIFPDRIPLYQAIQILDSCCGDNELKRDILHARFLPLTKHWVHPEYVSTIAKQLNLEESFVKQTLIEIRDDFLAKINDRLRRQRKKLLRPVPLTHLSPCTCAAG